jgi:hypothetical protein
LRPFDRDELAREPDVDDGAGCVDDETAECVGGAVGYEVEAGGAAGACAGALD